MNLQEQFEVYYEKRKSRTLEANQNDLEFIKEIDVVLEIENFKIENYGRINSG